MKKYRQLLSKISAALDVPETLMCGKRFRDLNFDRVPSQCLNKHRKAFLNESVAQSRRGRGPMAWKYPRDKGSSFEIEVTGDRFPLDEDRVLCRQHLRQAVLEQKVKGKQLQPHEIVKALLKTSRGFSTLSTLDRDLYGAQWSKIRQCLQQSLTSICPTKKGGVNLSKMIPLVDVSSSMSGTPLEVAIALGLLVSEVTHPLFRDRFLTFETSPRWIDVSSCRDIVEKIELARKAPWGGSTNFYAACELILHACVSFSLPPEEVPDLLVFSDMQFDMAAGYQCPEEAMLQTVHRRFAECGYDNGPKIVFWNLRGDTRGFPATAHSKGVQMLSGFSPVLLKAVMDSEPIDEVVTVRENQKDTISPLDTMRKLLDDSRYDLVRDTLRSSAATCAEIDRFVTSGQGVDLTQIGHVVGMMVGSTSESVLDEGY